MSDFNDLTKQRSVLQWNVQSFSKFVRELSDIQVSEIGFITLKERIREIKQIKDQFDEIQTKIELQAKDDSELESQYEYREKFRTSYFNSLATAKKIVNDNSKFSKSETSSVGSDQLETRLERNSVVTRQSGGTKGSRLSEGSIANVEQAGVDLNHIKLPVINLPKFNGNYQNWLEFRDTFQSLIHNNISISDIQKFHYLKASVEGEAALVIKSLEISSANYSVAWDALLDRYNNNKLLIYNHVKGLFGGETIPKESAVGIRRIIDEFSKNLRSLQQLNQPVGEWDTLLVYIISTKLDGITLREWENYKANIEEPKFEDIKTFLTNRADFLEMLSHTQGDRRKVQNTRSFVTVDSSRKHCANCSDDHYIHNCKAFLRLNVSERDKKARALRLCINCLRGGHHSKVCKRGACSKCGQKHNSLLHFDVSSNNKNQGQSSVVKEAPRVQFDQGSNHDRSNEQETTILSACGTVAHVFLSTAFIKILDNEGNPHLVRALLDCGSQSSFITKSLCNQLKLETENVRLTVKGFNDLSSKISAKCKIHMRAVHNDFVVSNCFFVIDKITERIPAVNVDVSELFIPPQIKLADPSFHKAGGIELLIGSDLFWDIVSVGQISLGTNKPKLQKTKFGWVVSGPLGVQSHSLICSFSQNLTEEQNIQKMLSRFWEIEEIEQIGVNSNEHITCEKHFIENTKRTPDGRFIVSIPFKDSVERLGDSAEQAKKRFFSLERKLHSKQSYKQLYVDFMREYRDLGHMQEVKGSKQETPNFFMPHHGVMREQSLTTKLRVVFDASATTTTGFSLNHLQHVGPNLQQELFCILIRFRQYKFVISADIAKMFRQILIDPTQRRFQKVWWREEPTNEMKVFELSTVTYGTTSAPYLAIRCLVELANEIEETKPDIAEIIKQDFYMDDLLSGSDSLETAANICLEIKNILKQGGFDLRKFYSNDKRVLVFIEDSGIEGQIVDFSQNENAKTLGVSWNPTLDKLNYRISENAGSRVTKRSILSEISQIFDPLGLLSPCVVITKMLLQKLWLQKIDWDETVPPELYTVWRDFRSQLPCLNELFIERRVVCDDAVCLELHGFSDASERAYGACVYVRSVNKEGRSSSMLLCSKSKVAPLKTLTLPRLELSAALILARLVKKVKISLRLEINKCFLWTDSSIVLGWLKIEPSKLKTFVSNRISEIQALTETDIWRHVPSEQNPADLISRGVKPQALKGNELWWHGPSWLVSDPSRWPEKQFSKNNNLLEMKKGKVLVFTIIGLERNYIGSFSNILVLKRRTAYILRFLNNCKAQLNSQSKQVGILTVEEINNALMCLVKVSQIEYFEREINKLWDKKPLNKDSKLLTLNPFLDHNGILRVGGRLTNAKFTFEKRHPIILSSKSHLAQLLARHTHCMLFHAGPQHTLATLREEYWVVGGRVLVKGIVRKCITCFKCKPKLTKPIMSSLPGTRLNPRTPFEVTGVDYAGPFLIKNRPGRGCKISKAYIGLFICFVTKAVHLELVTDLSKEAFLLALKRFVSRRGLPVTIFSDNGSNFKAASNELAELSKFMRTNENEITDYLRKNSINWEFIPPHSPHFGGLWEAGVKSVKAHLKRVTKDTALTYEHFYTLLVQVESILNSRPLSPMSDSPEDLTPLTPSHFLVGRPLTMVPEANMMNFPPNRLTSYQQIAQMKQHLWQRWSKEYVGELQERTKWKVHHSSLKNNTLVLIKEDNLPPMKWKLGRIQRIVAGPDGVCRVAEIKTETGLIKRSFSKICPLPFDSE